MSQKSLVPVNALSSASAPSTPTLRSGDLYYNTTTGLQVYNGTAWVSAGSAGITGVTAGTGLTGGGTSGTVTVSLSTPVAVANGGTGVTTSTGTGSTVLSTSPTLTTPTINNALLKSPEERWTVAAIAAATTVTFDVSAQGVLYYTSNATANWTLAATNVNTTLAVGDAMSIVFAVTNGATAYRPTALTIDGTANTPKWANGTAPSAGNANAVDWYSYVIVKTAATPTYTVFAGQSAKFA